LPVRIVLVVAAGLRPTRLCRNGHYPRLDAVFNRNPGAGHPALPRGYYRSEKPETL